MCALDAKKIRPNSVGEMPDSRLLESRPEMQGAALALSRPELMGEASARVVRTAPQADPVISPCPEALRPGGARAKTRKDFSPGKKGSFKEIRTE